MLVLVVEEVDVLELELVEVEDVEVEDVEVLEELLVVVVTVLLEVVTTDVEVLELDDVEVDVDVLVVVVVPETPLGAAALQAGRLATTLQLGGPLARRPVHKPLRSQRPSV